MFVLLALIGCGRDRREVARETEHYTRVPVETEHGLSGLAADTDGALWTISEREHTAYRIVLDAALQPAIESLRIDGVPRATDLEGIAWLGGDRFALGTEGRVAGVATVLLASRRGDALVVTGTIALSQAQVGITLAANHGAEGVCGEGETIFAAIEGAGTTGRSRWAPVVRIDGTVPSRTYRVALTTGTGKLSALDCRIAANGVATVWAIERHFEVTRLLAFELGDAVDVTPTVMLDLGPVLRGSLNLEGVALAGDRFVAVVDNQWRSITGPSEVLVFRLPAPGR